MNYATVFYHMNEFDFRQRNLCPVKSPTLGPLKYNVFLITSEIE